MKKIKRAKAVLENHSRLKSVYLSPLWVLRVLHVSIIHYTH